MATRPDVFLFDEPLSNLDARLRLEARTFLKQLQRELATTAVFVTHDQSEALALADRMAVMEAGVIRQVGTPSELFHHPANLFVAGFIGSTPMNLIPGVVVEGGVDIGGDVLPLRRRPGHHRRREVYYGIRPEYVTVDGDRRGVGRGGDHREPRHLVSGDRRRRRHPGQGDGRGGLGTDAG